MQTKLEKVPFGEATLVYVLKACGSVRVVDGGEQIHEGLLGSDIVLGTYASGYVILVKVRNYCYIFELMQCEGTFADA